MKIVNSKFKMKNKAIEFKNPTLNPDLTELTGFENYFEFIAPQDVEPRDLWSYIVDQKEFSSKHNDKLYTYKNIRVRNVSSQNVNDKKKILLLMRCDVIISTLK